MEGFEIIDSRFQSYVLSNAPLEKLGEGYRWLEGPVWFADLDCLLFSDIPNNRILRWTESSGVSVFREPSAFSNGHTRDRQGRLIGCSHKDRCITRTELDGRIVVLASHYQGKRFNSPNDIVVKSDDTIWFTDPVYGISTDYEGGKQTQELPPAVYRLDPRDGSLKVVANDFVGPNGLCFSPDEQRLYITDYGEQFDPKTQHHIRVFDKPGQSEALGEGRVFHKINPGRADGIRCDEHGNVWSTADDGVHCIDPDGKLLGKILVPFTVSNLVFGGRNKSRLFLCASHTLYSIYTNVRGSQTP